MEERREAGSKIDLNPSDRHGAFPAVVIGRGRPPGGERIANQDNRAGAGYETRSIVARCVSTLLDGGDRTFPEAGYWLQGHNSRARVTALSAPNEVSENTRALLHHSITDKNPSSVAASLKPFGVSSFFVT